ncbi:MAG: hypothetical protein GF401_19625 [Chitinivibrionales bacterium]|nr:hypothetical protein [Chitinivibrionales bacterium]
MTFEEEIKYSLIEIRKAYRALAVYHRFCLDLCKKIDTMLNTIITTGMTNYMWDSNVGKPPQSGDNLHKSKAVAFLPLWDFVRLLLPEKTDRNYPIIEKNDWLFVMRLSSDTGFEGDMNKDVNVDLLKDPEECESTLKLYIYYANETVQCDWKRLFSHNEWPKTGVKTFVKQAPEILAYSEKYHLSELTDDSRIKIKVSEFLKGAKRELNVVFG